MISRGPQQYFLPQDRGGIPRNNNRSLRRYLPQKPGIDMVKVLMRDEDGSRVIQLLFAQEVGVVRELEPGALVRSFGRKPRVQQQSGVGRFNFESGMSKGGYFHE
ncbi:hypothetical protein BH24BAC1_BH24BAC1_10220 [soil metagenome]